MLNKIDLLVTDSRDIQNTTALQDLAVRCQGPAAIDTVLISAAKGWGLDELRQKISQALGPVPPTGA